HAKNACEILRDRIPHTANDVAAQDDVEEDRRPSEAGVVDYEVALDVDVDSDERDRVAVSGGNRYQLQRRGHPQRFEIVILQHEAPGFSALDADTIRFPDYSRRAAFGEIAGGRRRIDYEHRELPARCGG